MGEPLQVPRPEYEHRVAVVKNGRRYDLCLTYDNTTIYRFTDVRYEHMNYALHRPDPDKKPEYVANVDGLVDTLAELGFPGRHSPAPDQASLTIYLLYQHIRLEQELGKLAAGEADG